MSPRSLNNTTFTRSTPDVPHPRYTTGTHEQGAEAGVKGLSDTIAAIATASGRGAIGIVKISGPAAFSIAEKVFERHACDSKMRIRPLGADGGSHRLHHGWIRDPRSRERIDEVLVGCMKGPFTYTGEDVVEINGHGGGQVLAVLLEVVLDCGARLAEPGEFTRRALLNGKIDLSQAEAVADLIDARSRRALSILARNMDGELGRQIETLRREIVGIAARIEAEIDFGEQIEDEIDSLCLATSIRDRIIPQVKRWIDQHRFQRGYFEGMKVAVIGRPNVGKSSIINRIVKTERLIVTDVPGTTRDLVDISVTLGDLPLVLTDTAGLHPSNDPVEAIGMGKTRSYLGQCELVVFVVDAAKPLTSEDYQIASLVQKRPVVLVYNKMDLLTERKCPPVPKAWSGWPVVAISARYDEHLNRLEKLIVNETCKIDIEPGSEIVPNIRQCRLLEGAVQHLTACHDRLMENGAGELASIEINDVLEKLDQVLGRHAGDQVLDEVFNRFCIGK